MGFEKMEKDLRLLWFANSKDTGVAFRTGAFNGWSTILQRRFYGIFDRPLFSAFYTVCFNHFKFIFRSMYIARVGEFFLTI